MLCNFTTTNLGDGRFRHVCSVCTTPVVTRSSRCVRQCTKGFVAEPPSLPKQLSSWAKAILKWEQAGKPVRTDEQVAAILEVCKGCKHFTGTKCKVCGCRVNVGPHAIINKARMATERCPRGKWGQDA